MPHASSTSSWRAAGYWMLLALLASGCQPGGSLERSGLKISVPEQWQPVDAGRWSVPGRPMAAWSGPEGSSLVVYRGLPVPGPASAERLGESLVNRVMNLPGLKVVDRRQVTLAGVPAYRIDLLAPGFGTALAPSGAGEPVSVDGQKLIPTRQATVIFARNAGPIFVSWHAPESAWGQVNPQIDSMLSQLALAADTTASSSSY